jgi:hypothetical protein
MNRKYVGRAGGMFHLVESSCTEKPLTNDVIYSDSAQLFLKQGMFPCPLCLDFLLPKVNELRSKEILHEIYEVG